MAINVYYGDGGYSTPDGNWNNTSNWFSSLFSFACCGCPPESPGTPLGRLPNASTDLVYVTCSGGGAQCVISTGPTGGYSGPISCLPPPALPYNPGSNFNIQTGLYFNTINFSNSSDAVISGGTFAAACSLTINKLSNSVFNGSVNASVVNGTTNCLFASGATIFSSTINGCTFSNSSGIKGTVANSNFAASVFTSGVSGFTAISFSSSNPITITGGTLSITAGTVNSFLYNYGTVNIASGLFNSITFINEASGAIFNISGGTFLNSRFLNTAGAKFAISGGVWAPIANVTINTTTNVLNYNTFPLDPGFAIGATILPTYTLSNLLPNIDILGAGLL